MIWQKVKRLIYISILTDAKLHPSQHPNPYHHPSSLLQTILCSFLYLNIRSLFNKKERFVLLHMILLYMALQ